MSMPIRIGTRDSRLALWQATQVQQHLANAGFPSVLTPIKSEGDIDLATPLYEMGVQGIFTRSLDIALLNNTIDIAVHSMKDVPTQLPRGIVQTAVLKRGPTHDLLVLKAGGDFLQDPQYPAHIATSSTRRMAQWLHKYPLHQIHNLRGNMQTRLQKLADADWDAAIFAEAGLERIGLLPEKWIRLDWMLSAPAQGAIMVVGRANDERAINACAHFNDAPTAACAGIERAFLRGLLGGCSTPVGALAEIREDIIYFKGNILSPDGKQKAEIVKTAPIQETISLGQTAAEELLDNGGREIMQLLKTPNKVS
mgnify:CR=1 FL=1